MGDRISIQFADERGNSIALFNHWGGKGFLRIVKRYMSDYRKQHQKDDHEPLGRFEPNTVMVDFIRWMTEQNLIQGGSGAVDSNYYFGKDENDGDNSDNGNYIITRNYGLTKKEAVKKMLIDG